MPVQQNLKSDYHPKKRSKSDKASHSVTKYASAAQIQSALHTEHQDVLNQTLVSLRNQLSLGTAEDSVGPADERLMLVKQWMESSSSAQELFSIWNESHTRQPSLTALVISNLAAVLTLLSAHYTNHSLGFPIMKTLLMPQRLRHMNSYISGSHNELIIVTLKLYNVMSTFAGGRDKKAILEGFGWEIKSLPRLLNMRRKSQERSDPLVRPDIRSLYILFLLSFLGADTLAQTKTAFLEQHKDAFLPIFRGIADDHYSLARRILEVCWSGIWEDHKLKRTLKVGIFSEITIGHLVKLYDRVQTDDEDEDHIPANLVHHFLLAICSRPGFGICFKDRGWYPREIDLDENVAKDEEEGLKKSGRIYNKILSNIIKTLKVNEDARQQELAIKILSACPELVSGYWSAAALTLEPRLSSKWLANIAIFGNIIALPIPEQSFSLPNQQYNPTPPPLSTITENIIPSVNTKNNFSKGLQSTSSLVQHSTALALCKCLMKFQAVLERFKKIANALEEDEEDGQWSGRCREVEREVRRRVPDFMVIIAFGQAKQLSLPPTSLEQTKSDQKPLDSKPTNKMKDALLAESAQRLLWLYHKCLPSVVAEARFDLGKLLHTFAAVVGQDAENDDDESDVEAAERLYRVQQLHVLSLLKESDNFMWTSKTGPQTSLSKLLAAMISTKTPAIQTALKHLIVHIFSRSILFQEDYHEAELWLQALPAKRPHSSHLPEHLSNGLHLGMQDEAQGVILFLDECVQRCLKTPYRYVEALRSLSHASVLSGDSGYATAAESYPSPLLMTLLEQLEAKTGNNSLIPSHVVGVVSFIRKVVFLLAGKLEDLSILNGVVQRLEVIRLGSKVAHDEVLKMTIGREVELLKDHLRFGFVDEDIEMKDFEASSELDAWLSDLEIATSTLKTLSSRTATAWLIVDKARTSRFGEGQFKRAAKLIAALDPLLLQPLLEHAPTRITAWSVIDIRSRFTFIRPPSSFEWLYILACNEQLSNSETLKVLKAVVSSSTPTLVYFLRIIYYIQHGVNSIKGDKHLAWQLSLLSNILDMAKSSLESLDFAALKEHIFIRSAAFKRLWTMPAPKAVLEVEALLAMAVSFTSSSDRLILRDVCSHWMNKLANLEEQHIDTAAIWIQYLEPAKIFDVLQMLGPALRDHNNLTRPIELALNSLAKLNTSDLEIARDLAARLPLLYLLYTTLPNSPVLEDLLATAINSLTPLSSNYLSTQGKSVAHLVKDVEHRWKFLRSNKGHVGLNVGTFLSQMTLSKSTSSIITGLLYYQPPSLEPVLEWLSSLSCPKQDLKLIAPICDVLSEISASRSINIGHDVWVLLIPSLVTLLVDSDIHSRLHAGRCLRAILSCPDFPSNLVAHLVKAFQALPGRSVTPELLGIGIYLARNFAIVTKEIQATLVDRGIEWAIHHLEECSEIEQLVIFHLTSLVQAVADSKGHLVDILCAIVIRRHLSNAMAVDLLVSALSTCHMKPAVVNRHLQSIIQHPRFPKLMLLESVKDSISRLLHNLFNLHPHNTCQITHVEPLMDIYRGTLSHPDLRLLSIFRLFEAQRKLSIAPLLSRWSPLSGASSTSALEALQSLDPIMVLKTYIDFPYWRTLNDQIPIEDDQGCRLYDPVFLILLFGQVFAERPPSTAFEWLELLRTNVISLFIRVLSAKDGQLREIALSQLIALWSHVKNADLQEKPHVLHLLDLLKNVLIEPSSPSLDNSSYPNRLPTHISLLLAHAHRGVFYPSNFIYLHTANFLLQRPSIDLWDVPMLYGMLYSSSDEHWRKERAWMVKFLADGMVGSDDWKVLKRRHTWDLLASLFQSEGHQSPGSPSNLRSGILNVLANLTCNQKAATSLVTKSALLPWIETQLLGTSAMTEAVEWIRILENILVAVDVDKVEAATKGEWRFSLCRCIGYLLDYEDKGEYPSCLASTLIRLRCATPVILRLASIRCVGEPQLEPVMKLAVRCLEAIEKDLQVTDLPQFDNESAINYQNPPHRSTHLRHKLPVELRATSFAIWANLVEVLWTSAMLMDQKSETWDSLAYRLLLLSNLPSESRSNQEVGKWVRWGLIAALDGSTQTT